MSDSGLWSWPFQIMRYGKAAQEGEIFMLQHNGTFIHFKDMNSCSREKRNQLLLNSETELQGGVALMAAVDRNPRTDVISGTLLQSKALFFNCQVTKRNAGSTYT